MEQLKGNLVELALMGEYDVIIHGANCFNTMGAGIAKTIKETWPEAYRADLATKKGDMKKLGSFSSTTVSVNNKNLTIINAYTQYMYGRGRDFFEYDSFSKILKKIKKEYSGKRIGMPFIGSGHAGGDPQRILDIIKTELNGENVQLVELNPNPRLKLKL